MLAELLRYFTLRCPPWARLLGMAREHVAITYRHRRTAAAWAPHLDASKAAILEGAERCRERRRALVIGAGDCRDVPVAELAARFDEVVLTDVVLGPELRRFARRSGGKVRAEVWDATGVLAELARGWRSLTPGQVEVLFAKGDPGQPPGGEPDLVVSANCISQLGIVPVDSFPGAKGDEAFSERCGAAAARRHVQWLAARTGVRVLLGDRARLDVAADGRELKRERMPGMDGLRKPDREWRWLLAPIPEWSADFDRVHEVGAWIDGPSRAAGRNR
ncbi:MAG TPA: hypothetical protein VK178_10760 [Opitutaceae bacterium]|nr:hypothetical protein [Opitutaceae bacterium]